MAIGSKRELCEAVFFAGSSGAGLDSCHQGEKSWQAAAFSSLQVPGGLGPLLLYFWDERPVLDQLCLVT